jgi:L-asparaginase
MTDNKEHIHIIATGGTIDSVFSPREYKPVPNSQSYIQDFIEEFVKPHFTTSLSTVTMIDSLYMDEAMREDILRAVQESPNDKILITHGTDGMIRTAQKLEEAKESFQGKTVMLVGAMIPLKGFSPSDAGFNLGFAIAHLMREQPGIHIAMNGQLFTPANVRKNTEKTRFEFAS